MSRIRICEELRRTFGQVNCRSVQAPEPDRRRFSRPGLLERALSGRSETARKNQNAHQPFGQACQCVFVRSACDTRCASKTVLVSLAATLARHLRCAWEPIADPRG